MFLYCFFAEDALRVLSQELAIKKKGRRRKSNVDLDLAIRGRSASFRNLLPMDGIL